MIADRLAQLRNEMKKAGIDCYVIPTSDDHNSEYVSEYFMVREYFSGFTGSAGTLVVFADQAALFTDGRYFIQAEKELDGSEIILMKAGEPGVLDIKSYIRQTLEEGQIIGFDGRVVTAEEGIAFAKIAEQAGGKVIFHLDLAEVIWKDRPAVPATRVFALEEKYTGESAQSKLTRLRQQMKEADTPIYLLTALDEIAWLLNLRAHDIQHCPVFLANAVVTEKEVFLFADESAFETEEMTYLSQNGVVLNPYENFYTFVDNLTSQCREERFLTSKKQMNYRLYRIVTEKAEIADRPSPIQQMKAVKNEVEQKNLKAAHLMDALAVTKFMYWLKENVGKTEMTELSASDFLASLRAENSSYIEPSFTTICAYGENGAMIHYSANQKQNAVLKAEGLLMVDSGGHYYEGSTDITRTFVLGDLTDEMRQDFTLVTRAMLRLQNVRFLYGCKGVNLDLAAREVFWEKGLDYKHGTGHGVGYLLNVHEGPNSFRYKSLSGEPDWVFEEGMVTTDEPGIYREGSHGVRIENELLCRKGKQNEFGQFMEFEPLTFVPIDLDGIDRNLMEEKEIQMLNQYHEAVYQKLSAYLEEDMRIWLKRATRKI